MTIEKAGQALALINSGTPTHKVDPDLMKALSAEVDVIIEALRRPGEERIMGAVRFSSHDRSDWSHVALRLWEAVENASQPPRLN